MVSAALLVMSSLKVRVMVLGRTLLLTAMLAAGKVGAVVSITTLLVASEPAAPGVASVRVAALLSDTVVIVEPSGRVSAVVAV